jgi:hypothetical protein
MSGMCHGEDSALFMPVLELFVSCVIRDSRFVRSNVLRCDDILGAADVSRRVGSPTSRELQWSTNVHLLF